MAKTQNYQQLMGSPMDVNDHPVDTIPIPDIVSFKNKNPKDMTGMQREMLRQSQAQQDQGF